MSKPEDENQNDVFNTILAISPCLFSLLIIFRTNMIWAALASVILSAVLFNLAASKRQRIAAVIACVVPTLLLSAITFGYQIGKGMALRDNSICVISSKN